MAYITAEQVKEMRQRINKTFPVKEGWKISVRRENYSGVRISILAAPVNFTDRYENGRQIWPTKEDHHYLQQIYNIANSGNYDNSDLMTDYFDVGWYVSLKVGDYDKPFKFTKKVEL